MTYQRNVSDIEKFSEGKQQVETLLSKKQQVETQSDMDPYRFCVLINNISLKSHNLITCGFYQSHLRNITKSNFIFSLQYLKVLL